VGKLFLAGIGPGILIFLLFSIYSYLYSVKRNVGRLPKANWNERIQALKAGMPVMGFPVVVIGGIFSGIFSPTEAAAASVAYALILEILVYKSLTYSKIRGAFLQTGVITGVVLILVGAGQAFTWLLSFLRIPQEIMPVLFGADPSNLRVIFVVIVSYFIACMFVDPIVAIYIMSPIFHPYVTGSGVDPILLGVLVTLQCAIGSATPPFGCDIFTAQLIFRRPYLEVVRHAPPFIMILILVTILLVMFPSISLFIPSIAF
jgi:tripartite ATP-independent transporter DctM subunit